MFYTHYLVFLYHLDTDILIFLQMKTGIDKQELRILLAVL
jgi:hypothetical protein